jgi:hypothetical protein
LWRYSNMPSHEDFFDASPYNNQVG